MPVPERLQEDTSGRGHRRGAACFPRDDRGSPTCAKLPKREMWSTTPRSSSHFWKSSVHSEDRYEVVEERHRGERNRLVRPSSNWKIGIIHVSKMHVYLERERQMVPFVNETGEGKCFGKGRTVHFEETDKEWCISGNAPESDVTWSFDPDEAVWWCGCAGIDNS